MTRVHCPKAMICETETKQVGLMTSGKKSQLVTLMFTTSATGKFYPFCFYFHPSAQLKLFYQLIPRRFNRSCFTIRLG